jgi:hypothetical protein
MSSIADVTVPSDAGFERQRIGQVSIENCLNTCSDRDFCPDVMKVLQRAGDQYDVDCPQGGQESVRNHVGDRVLRDGLVSVVSYAAGSGGGVRWCIRDGD